MSLGDSSDDAHVEGSAWLSRHFRHWSTVSSVPAERYDARG
jgi:hypothetical protein